MTNDPLREAAELELQQLHSELKKTPIYLRIKQLEQVVALLAGPADTGQAAPTIRVSRSFAVSLPESDSPKTKTERIADAVEAYLEANPGWRSVTEIYDDVVRQGVDIGGLSPRGNLTAHMSSSGRFLSDRQRGWRLKVHETKKVSDPERLKLERTNNTDDEPQNFSVGVQ